MEKDEYQCNKHENLEDLLEFYDKAAADYDKVHCSCCLRIISSHLGFLIFTLH